MALLPQHNWSVDIMYSVCFHFSLEKVTCYIPSGSHNFTSCIVLKAPKHQASLLHQWLRAHSVMKLLLHICRIVTLCSELSLGECRCEISTAKTLKTGDKSGSMFYPQRGSVLISMTWSVTKHHVDVGDLGCHLGLSI